MIFPNLAVDFFEISIQLKLEVLQERDNEMTEFIEKFGSARDEVLADQRAAKGTILGLLEHISSGLESQNHIPDKERMMVQLLLPSPLTV